MTLLSEEKQKIFFNKVKGGKIRYNDWCVGEYFIPETLESEDGRMGGFHVYPGRSRDKRHWNLFNGFDPTASHSFHWEFLEGGVELRDHSAIKKACDCPLEKLMNLGCSCGGI